MSDEHGGRNRSMDEHSMRGTWDIWDSGKDGVVVVWDGSG